MTGDLAILEEYIDCRVTFVFDTLAGSRILYHHVFVKRIKSCENRNNVVFSETKLQEDACLCGNVFLPKWLQLDIKIFCSTAIVKITRLCGYLFMKLRYGNEISEVLKNGQFYMPGVNGKVKSSLICNE